MTDNLNTTLTPLLLSAFSARIAAQSSFYVNQQREPGSTCRSAESRRCGSRSLFSTTFAPR